ncbi:MAG TPA: amidase [Actinomycetota bacterium]|jgi:amidase
MDAEYSELDATALAELVRSGAASPEELVDEAIARIEKLNPQLNAVIHARFDKARTEASSVPDGPFKGVPMVIKDLDGYSAGDPFHGGMKFLKELGWTSDHDSYLFTKLRAAGFLFVGKTSCPELGLIPSTEPEAYGPTRNPWNLERSPGGSSGGTAAAVASRMVPLGHGGDGGGSIRIPSSACGLVGLKASRGRISLGPDKAESWSGLVIYGGLTRTVRDAAGFLDVVSGPMPGDPYAAPTPARPFLDEVGADPGRLRIGWSTDAPGGLAQTDPQCVASVEHALSLLESIGHTVEDARPDDVADDEVTQHAINIISANIARALDDWSEKTGKRIGPDDVELHTWTFAEFAKSVTATQYLASLEALQNATRASATWWSDYDILVTPTLPEPPWTFGSFTSTPENPLQGTMRSGQIVPFVAPLNISGQPGVSLPLYWSDDELPIGVQLVAAYGREDLLIRVASQLEEAQPWSDRRPPVS